MIEFLAKDVDVEDYVTDGFLEGKANVLWEMEEEYRSWGIKDVLIRIKEITVYSKIENEDGETVGKRNIYTDAKVIGDNRIPLTPETVIIEKDNIIVDFGGER